MQTEPKSISLEDYFRTELKNNTIDFSLRVMNVDGVIRFYIHPAGKDGLTADYLLHENKLTPVLVTGGVSDGN